MKKRQRIQKADAAEAAVTDDSSATHRLTGISVKEVSIVDRAANKRKYLLVKEEEQKNAGVAKGEEDASKAVPGSPAQPPAAPAPPGPPTTPQPPTLRISPELKAKVAGVLKTVQERVGVISKVLEGSSETPGAAAPQELMTALNELATMITQAAAPAAPPAPPAAPAPPPAAAKEETETEKAGRKISAGRLQQLNSIQTSLSALIADVTAQAETGESGGGGDAGAAAATTEPAAAASAEKSAAASTEITELKTTIAAMVESQANMMKVFEQQNARIAELSKSRGESRQVDLDRQTTNKAENKVVWDMDMARPMKRVD